MLRDILTLKFLTGFRTKFIGGGMILGGLAAILTHLAAVIGGEALNWDTLQSGGVSIATGFGLITAAAHKAE